MTAYDDHTPSGRHGAAPVEHDDHGLSGRHGAAPVEHDDHGPSRWVHRLAPVPGDDAPATPAGTASGIAEATDRLGPAPVAWAVQVGHHLARVIIDTVPELGGGDAPFETLRMGTEAATLHALMLLADPSTEAAVPEESLRGDREFARRRIPLDKVLRGIRVAHAALTRSLMTGCQELVPPGELAREFRRVSELLFGYMDTFSSHMTAEYLAEHDRWTTSGAAAREETVRLLLAGEPVRQDTAAQVLDHSLEGRQLAVIAWCDTLRAEATSDLQAAAAELLHRRGCSSALVVPVGGTTVWAWGSPHTHQSAPRRSEQTFPADLRFACGSVREGLAGFRQSHEDARHAQRVGRLNPRGTGQLVDHQDVEMAALLSTDLPALRRFVSDELGALAADTPHADRLRETVRRYLRHERSLTVAAAQLHVARNTVTYRVKRAQELLGHDLAARLPELMAALEAARVLGPAVLRRRSDGPRDGAPHHPGRRLRSKA
ncbi:PucR family transcriptional regulator [Streptomyces sp. NPDC001595]|uniref:PucR family transcriptional regulator n=1 Tax=Streptomyces sp. NPDC001532 TaxID=3154520 RepID=UPI0033284C96